MDLDIRFASHPNDVKHYDTATLREHFLIDTLFAPDAARLTYSHVDRIIAGGIMPVGQKITLEAGKEMGVDCFFERREAGIINAGGKGMALALAQAGADIIGVGVSDSAATAEAVKALGGRYLAITADLTDKSCVPDIIARANNTFSKIDILVNNAGTIRRNDFVDFTEEDWDAVMDLNLKTLFFLSQAVAREFIAQQSGGKIIHIASMLSSQGGIRVASYTSSKSGIKGLTMLMANELAPHGINVNAIAPGYMATDNTEQLRADAKRNDEILAHIPAGRWGLPEDLAGAVVFLASDAANYVQGHTLAVDGGWLAR